MLLTLGVPFRVTFCGIHKLPSNPGGGGVGVSLCSQDPDSPLAHYFRTSKHFHHKVPLPCPFYFTNKGK